LAIDKNLTLLQDLFYTLRGIKVDIDKMWI